MVYAVHKGDESTQQQINRFQQPLVQKVHRGYLQLPPKFLLEGKTEN